MNNCHCYWINHDCCWYPVVIYHSYESHGPSISMIYVLKLMIFHSKMLQHVKLAGVKTQLFSWLHRHITRKTLKNTHTHDTWHMFPQKNGRVFGDPFAQHFPQFPAVSAFLSLSLIRLKSRILRYPLTGMMGDGVMGKNWELGVYLYVNVYTLYIWIRDIMKKI